MHMNCLRVTIIIWGSVWGYQMRKYKLNMLEPGCKMMKAIGIFGVISLMFYIIKLVVFCFIFGGLAILLGIILWILIIVESHQDKVLNEQAVKERRKNGED
jgi:hypothetical protein